jgi:hypothetical protein
MSAANQVRDILESIDVTHNENFTYVVAEIQHGSTLIKVCITLTAGGQYQHACADVTIDDKTEFSAFVAPNQPVLCPVFKHI